VAIVGSLGYRPRGRERLNLMRVERKAISEAPVIGIRRATPADTDALAVLGRDTFAETFGHLYPATDLAAFLNEAHAAGLYADWAVDPAFGLWVAETQGTLVGYALAGPCHLPHPEVTAECGELWRLYVRAAAQGASLGAGLLERALGWLEQPGRRLWIGVWSGNLGAQRLYARYGFSKVGDYAFSVGETRDHEFILARPAS
jgi:diamine N-acetyltransferase